ncbi:MAG: YfhO family protein [Verrucomicrobiota bacterium]
MGRRDVYWLALLVVVLGWFFHETLFQGHTMVPTDMLNQLLLPYGRNVERIAVQNHYTMDVLEQDYPWGLFWKKSVQAGEWPLWNPEIAGGQPHLATSMAGVFSPFRLLYLVLPAERALSLGIVASFVCAALFMFLFLREIGRSPVAAFVGGAAWALNSAMLLWYWRLPSVQAWVPLALFCFERSQRLNSIPWLVGTSLSLALAWLGGNVQSACHVALLCGIYFLFARSTRPRVGHIALVLAGAMALAAIQWLPTLELLHLDATGRVETAGPRATLRHTVLGLGALVTFIFPGLAGSTETFDLLKAVPASIGDFTGSIGLVGVALAVLGVGGARDRRLRALWIAAVLAIVLVLCTPFVKYLYHRLLIVVVFALCVSTAAGIDLCLNLPAANRRLARRILGGFLLAGGLLLVGLVITQGMVWAYRPQLMERAQGFIAEKAGTSFFGAQLQWQQDRLALFLDHYRPTNPVFWLPVVCLAGVALAGWRRRWLAGTIITASLCELIVLGRPLVPQVDLTRYPLYPPLQPLAETRSEPDLFRVLNYNLNQSGFLPSNFLMTYGLTTPTGYESLAPANLQMLPVQAGTNFNNLLDLQNVRFVVCPATVRLPEPRLTFVTEGAGLRVYRNPNCLPRAQLLTHWEITPTPLATMQSPGFRPDEVVVLEQDPGFPSAATTNFVAHIEHYQAQQVIIRTAASQPSILLLADTWYPGWRATLDGKPVPILRADAVLRAVAVPAGDHAVEFRYAPTSFRIGALMSGTALVVFAIALGRSCRVTLRA